jgi:hypothetical protein
MQISALFAIENVFKVKTKSSRGRYFFKAKNHASINVLKILTLKQYLPILAFQNHD